MANIMTTPTTTRQTEHRIINRGTIIMAIAVPVSPFSPPESSGASWTQVRS